MNRQDIERNYDVDANGVIHSPGKFEGEMLYAVYFYDALLNGFADSDDDGVATFNVTDEDRALFPELANVKQIQMEESEQGFIYMNEVE